MATFSYREMYFPCACGRKNTYVKIGVATDFRLHFAWRCQCGKSDQTLLTFEQMAELMPPPPVPDVTELDARFCKLAGITLEEA
jgi:hypothetical protein